jgi:hypothetical protein
MEHSDLTDTVRLRQLYSRRVAERAPGEAGAHVAPEAILAVVRTEGTEEERLATLEHVMSCAECHRDYEWLSAVDQAGLEAQSESEVRRPRWFRPAPLAAAASLLLVAGTVLVLQERRVGEVVRGGDNDIALAAPPANAQAGGSITFAWHPLKDASRYVLEVQRADRSVAFSDTTSDTTFTLAEPARMLPEGEYRWWVRETTDGAEPRSSGLRSLRIP